MPQTDMGNLDTSALSTALDDYSVDSQSVEGVYDQKETTWTNTDWTQWFGYYKQIPELMIAIDAKATWTVGKGYQADEVTTMLLDSIRGWGKDTFNTILENMIRTYHIGGDAFAEIITDDDGTLINLKPLDPETIMIVAGRNGRIKRYEQMSKVKGQTNKKFKPNKILHLARNRVADEIHGTSIIPAIENIILMRNEAMTDWKRVLHRNVDPMWIFHLDTDDTTKIAAVKAKMDEARGEGENLYIPKGAVVPEVVTTAGNASLNPLPWIESLNSYFFQAVGVPDIIVGGTGAITEASAKIAYLAFQQTIEEEQLFIEEQVLSQLNLVIELEFPASLEQEALSDKPKIENRGLEQGDQPLQPNDVETELEGRT